MRRSLGRLCVHPRLRCLAVLDGRMADCLHKGSLSYIGTEGWNVIVCRQRVTHTSCLYILNDDDEDDNAFTQKQYQYFFFTFRDRTL